MNLNTKKSDFSACASYVLDGVRFDKVVECKTNHN